MSKIDKSLYKTVTISGDDKKSNKITISEETRADLDRKLKGPFNQDQWSKLTTLPSGLQIKWKPMTLADEEALTKDPKSGQQIRKALADRLFPKNQMMNSAAQDPEILKAISNMESGFKLESNFIPAVAQEELGRAFNAWVAEARGETKPLEAMLENLDTGESHPVEITNVLQNPEDPNSLLIVTRVATGMESGYITIPCQRQARVHVWKCFGCGESGWVECCCHPHAKMGHSLECLFEPVFLDGWDDDPMAGARMWGIRNDRLVTWDDGPDGGIRMTYFEHPEKVAF